ncbi:hypothetical protein FNO01nite_16120 [Flavobacterium noncentrifugens]|uniref:Uncharacterized protein n=1 Tax=Flavobacterium noncentrifugens TaxID=1128970 RepID=A0A1G8WHU8_9FLAO|nr:hypothetical protein [Flavobacterium noncentrifugens]GEP50940.1 hypothetical protein FNO01nite_16120 [Flavobacterium noncentrifugens]SDJ77899.1 hypothetical protein SAMN04487935_1830 [Flavobacterium noncentrifugens]
MSEKKYNSKNFHRYTFCIFKQVGLSEIQNQKPNYKSKSGSSYFFTETGVYRLSNHWGRAANCKWRLQPSGNSGTERTKLGFAKWEQFHPDNDTEKLYVIEVDFENDSVIFNHKSNESKSPAAILRTASETTKRIKQIRNLLDNHSWTQYYPQKDRETLKKEVITKLIQTEKSLQEIKAEVN